MTIPSGIRFRTPKVLLFSAVTWIVFGSVVILSGVAVWPALDVPQSNASMVVTSIFAMALMLGIGAFFIKLGIDLVKGRLKNVQANAIGSILVSLLVFSNVQSEPISAFIAVLLFISGLLLLIFGDQYLELQRGAPGPGGAPSASKPLSTKPFDFGQPESTPPISSPENASTQSSVVAMWWMLAVAGILLIAWYTSHQLGQSSDGTEPTKNSVQFASNEASPQMMSENSQIWLNPFTGRSQAISGKWRVEFRHVDNDNLEVFFTSEGVGLVGFWSQKSSITLQQYVQQMILIPSGDVVFDDNGKPTQYGNKPAWRVSGRLKNSAGKVSVLALASSDRAWLIAVFSFGPESHASGDALANLLLSTI